MVVRAVPILTLPVPVLAFAACLGLLAALGCGGSTTVPVSGSVRIDGQAADYVLVRLHPVDPSPESASVRPLGYTEPDGTFSLTSFAAGDGAPPGRYKVTLEWRSRPKSTMETGGPDKLRGRYADMNGSTIDVTVAPPTTELEPIEVSSK